MVRGTTRALAGTAAKAARKVIGRRPRPADGATDASAVTPAKKAPATKAPAKKTPAKKAAAKKTPAKKTPAKKTPATEAPAKKAPATKAPARKAAPTARKTSASSSSAATKTVDAPAPKTARKSPKTANQTTTSSKATTTKVTTAKKTTTTAPPAKKAAKKAAGKTSTAALFDALVVKEGEEPWTKAEVQEVIDELHEARSHSVTLLGEAEAGLDGLMRDSGDGAGQDQADMGATTFERDHELTVVNSERDKLAQIDRALGHIDDGTYGVCESCGEPIGKGRLMAFPRATLCMTCKQREERR